MIVNISWTANTELDLLSYRVYAGRASGVYTQNFTIDGQTNPFLPIDAPIHEASVQLDDGVLWYIAVTALDVTGNESAKSNEVSKINKYTNFRVS